MGELIVLRHGQTEWSKAGKHTVLQDVTHEAHAAQHQEHTQRRSSDRQGEAPRQRATHETQRERLQGATHHLLDVVDREAAGRLTPGLRSIRA